MHSRGDVREGWHSTNATGDSHKVQANTSHTRQAKRLHIPAAKIPKHTPASHTLSALAGTTLQ
jgi:hypothetical protein